MRLSTIAPPAFALAVIATLTSGLVSPTAATGGDRADGAPDAREHVAQRTLEQVQDAFGRSGSSAASDDAQGRDLTLLLRDLSRLKSNLPPAERAIATRVLARPGSDQKECNPNFCVHWVTAGVDAPPPADSDSNDIPDQVDDTVAAFSKVWNRTVTQGGYRAPLPDRAKGAGNTDDRFDVYLKDLGKGTYGYCNTTKPAVGVTESPRVKSAFCVLDDDYDPDDFKRQTPLENLQVTAAHEFFHAVQFAYDAFEDPWFMEGTATWIEDEIYDEVNDNRQYLNSSPMTRPSRALDNSNSMNVYGNWIWWRFLSEKYDGDAGTSMPRVIRDIWERADHSDETSFNKLGVYSIKAVDRELAQRKTSLEEQFAKFGVANRNPKDFYEDGKKYPASALQNTIALKSGVRSSGKRFQNLDHLGAAHYSFRPTTGLDKGAWKLRVRVDGPSRGHSPYAVLTVIPKGDGAPNIKKIKLNKAGVGKKTVGFNSTQVRAVELTLANAGHKYKCQKGTQFSCQGRPKDDSLRFSFTGTAVK